MSSGGGGRGFSGCLERLDSLTTSYVSLLSPWLYYITFAVSHSVDWATLKKCKAYVEQNVTMVDQNTYFPLKNLENNTGGFTLSGGAVVFPETGVYLISGVVSGDSVSTSWYVQIRNTNGKVYESVLNRTPFQQFSSVSLPATLCSVTAGQKVGLYNKDSKFNMNSGIDNGFRGTTMTVIKVE